MMIHWACDSRIPKDTLVDQITIQNMKFDNLTQLLGYHIRIHKGFQLRDAYKLIYQSVFGPEHLGASISEHSIAEEMRNSAGGIEEPLSEPISVDATVCRINLRVVKRLGISPATVADAVQGSVGKFSRDGGELSQLWREVGDSLDARWHGFSNAEYEEMTGPLREEGYPPMHHSSSYRVYNHPAYRVLSRSEMERVMPDLPANDLWR